MKVLVVGGAGYIGSIIRPALEARHTCRYFDMRPVPGRKSASIVGDVNDAAKVHRAVRGVDAVVYLAMGVPRWSTMKQDHQYVHDIDTAFGVNVKAMYRFLHEALEARVRTFVYASTMSIYNQYTKGARVSEETPGDAWHPYGMTKRLGEYLCHAAGQEYPRATIVALRIVKPRNEVDWPGREYKPGSKKNGWHLGPEDTRSLFLAAAECRERGVHFLPATGDLEQKRFDMSATQRVLGWLPEGR